MSALSRWADEVQGKTAEQAYVINNRTQKTEELKKISIQW